MGKRSTPWLVAAAVFVLVNVAGIIYGAAMADPAHTTSHVVLLFAGFAAWRFLPWGRKPDAARELPVDERRIEYLQQSVDAIALEVERIGEKQRFTDKLRVEGGEKPQGER
jgi:hypothetical protein